MQPEQIDTNSQQPTPEALPPEPVLSSSVEPTVTALTPATNSRRKKLLLIIVVAAVIVLAGAIAAYALWYNNPNKVAADALLSVLHAKTPAMQGTITTQNGSSEASVTNFSLVSQNSGVFSVNGNSVVATGGKKVTVSGDFVSDSSTLYIRIAGLKNLLTASAKSDENAASALALLGGPLNEIDGKWVSITAGDWKQLSSLIPSLSAPDNSHNQFTCVQQANNTFQNSAAQQAEVANAYLNNPFIIVQQTLGTQVINSSTSNHYILSEDHTKSAAFGKAIEKTTYFKNLNTCLNNALSDTDKQVAETTGPQPTVELWADQWTHELTRFKITQKEDGTTTAMDIKTQLNKPQKITIPKADTSLSDLVSDLQKSFLGIMQVPAE